MTYKVIKPFGVAVKGDVFNNSGDPNSFEMLHTEGDPGTAYSECYMAISKAEADAYVADGYLIKVDEAEPCQCDCQKLARVTTKVNELIEGYTDDYNRLKEEYEEGNVQQCVKVEAETVYTNMIKVLNCIKKILDE